MYNIVFQLQENRPVLRSVRLFLIIISTNSDYYSTKLVTDFFQRKFEHMALLLISNIVSALMVIVE